MENEKKLTFGDLILTINGARMVPMDSTPIVYTPDGVETEQDPDVDEHE